MKLRSYTSYVGNVVCAHQKLLAYVSVGFFFFFSAAHLIFTSLVARISHLLTPNCHVLLPTKFASFVFLSNALALSLLSTSVKTFENLVRLDFVVAFSL